MDAKIPLQYKIILNECNKTQKKFVDDEFPANSESLGVLSEKIKSNKMQWLRPHAIKCKNKTQDWSVCGDISPSNISQGALGDCWFMSSIAVVASKPELVRRLILTPELNPAGAYVLRLCKDGVWKTVIVDDLLPCDEYDRPIFAKPKGNQLWVCLLEKALAKLYGSYHALKAGYASEGLVNLTGFPTQTLKFNHDRNAVDSGRLDVVWQTLLPCSKAGFLIGISCGRPEVSKEDYEAVGLISQHVYSLLQARSISGFRLLQLKNPWGKQSWKGDWNSASRLWTSELVGKLNPSKEDDGTFWISFQDAVKYFSHVDICQIRPSWQDHRFEGTFTKYESQTVCYYEILVTKPTEIEYALYQASPRSLGKKAQAIEEIQVDMCLILVLLEDTENTTPRLKRCIGSSPREFSSCVIGKVWDSILKPGTYAVIPISIKSLIHNREENIYALSIQSSTDIQVRKKEVPSEFLTDSIIVFAYKSGERKDCSQDFSFYERYKWSGAILLAENKHPEKYLRVSLNMSGSQNMISSRAPRRNKNDTGMETWDVLPPSTRQILAVLTSSSPSEGYSMSYEIRYHHVRERNLGGFAPGIDGQGKRHLPPLESELHQRRKI